MYDIKCEVIDNKVCGNVRGNYLISRFTPDGMCAASFVAIWPFVSAMRHSEKTDFEDPNGEVTLTCPDGLVEFKLSRIKQPE